MILDLRRRLAHIEAHQKPGNAERAATRARHERRVADLRDFIDTAWPDHSESLAHYTALILGLPHSAAFRDVLRGEAVEAVAARVYGPGWRVEMENTAAEAAAACERAHGQDWRQHFDTIWSG